MNTIFKKKKTVLLLTVVFVAGLFVVMMPAVSYGDAAVDVPASDSSSSSGGDTHSSSSARKNTAPAQRRTYQKPYNNNTGGTQGRTYPRSYSNNTGRTQGNTYPRSYGNNMGRSQSNTYPRSYSNNTGRTQGSTYPKSYNNNTTNTQGNTYSGSSTGNAATSSQTQPVKEPEKYTKADIKAAKDSISKIPGLVIKGTKNLIHEIPNKVTVISNGDKKIFYSGNKGELTLRDIKDKVKSEFQDAEKQFYEKGKLLADDIEKEYDNAVEENKETVEKRIEAILAVESFSWIGKYTFPKEAKEELSKILADKMINYLKVNPKMYDKCNSQADYINATFKKMSSEISAKEKKFEFKYVDKNNNQVTYYINLEMLPTIGGAAISYDFNMTDDKDRKYVLAYVIKSEKDIKAEMDALKDLAQSKIKEAKKAAVDDAKQIVLPDELKVLLKSAGNEKVMAVLSKKNPSLKSRVEKAKDIVEKYKTFKKAYKSVTNTNADRLPKVVTSWMQKGYLDKYNKYIDAINDL